ncbi:MAG: hypothetical protein FJ303_21780 [Planctomycetes bacterium]|nr:hypothetical protein [Planctomycetota bacterium]
MSDLPERSPIASAPISVILFAHALSTDTQDGLKAWRQFLDKINRPYEIFLIQETRPEIPPDPNLPPDAITPSRTFSYDRSQGFREAIHSAIRSAQYPLVAFCTADKQYQPSDLDRLLSRIDTVDLVVGYREGGEVPGWRSALDSVLGVLSWTLLGLSLEARPCWLGSEGWDRRWVAYWIFGVRVYDPECPFRLARREIFECMPIQSGGAFFPVEVIAKANHLGYYLTEEAVTWTPPTAPHEDAISFGDDARLIFHDAEFAPPKAVTPPSEPPLADAPAA